MRRPFQRFNQILNRLVARSQACVQCDGSDDKSLFRRGVAASVQAATEQTVHCALKGSAGAPLFLLNEPGNVIVDGKSGSHIMML